MLALLLDAYTIIMIIETEAGMERIFEIQFSFTSS